MLLSIWVVKEGHGESNLKYRDKSKIAMGYGVAFHHEGIALLNLGNFDLLVNVSLRALQWEGNSATILSDFEKNCETFTEEQADLKLVCGYLMPVYQEYRKRNEIFHKFVNTNLFEEIPMLLPGIRLNRIPEQIVKSLPDTWFQNMGETLTRHLANVTKQGKWVRAGNRFTANLKKIHQEAGSNESQVQLIQQASGKWVQDLLDNSDEVRKPEAPNLKLGRGEEPEEEIQSWSWVSRRQELGTDWEKHVRNNPQLSNYTIPVWVKRIMRVETNRYKTYWKSVYRMKINEIRAIRMDTFQEVRNHPGVFQELWQRFQDSSNSINAVVGDRVTSEGMVDYIAMADAHEQEVVRNSIRITLLPAIRVLWNAWTKLSVTKLREQAGRVELRETEKSDGFRKLKIWLDREYVYWRSAPTGVGISSRIRAISRPRERRQAVAIGMGMAALVGSAVSATSSMMSVHQLSEKFDALRQGQDQDHSQIAYLTGAMAALSDKSLKACEKLQQEIVLTRKELKEVSNSMQELARDQAFQTEELVKMHVALWYETDTTSRLISLMMKEMALQEYYLAQLHSFKESIQRIQQGVLPEYLVSPSELQKLLRELQPALAAQSRSFVPVFTEVENYYKLKTTGYAMRNGSLIINVKIPLRKYNDPVLDVFSTEVARVPITSDGSDNKFTQLNEDGKIIGLAHSTYVEMTKEQLSRCAKINRLFLCAGTVLVQTSTEKQCLSAVFANERADKVKGLCTFTISTGKPKPQLIETEEEVLLANVPENWDFLCDSQEVVPTGVKPGTYVLFKKAFLCHCSIRTGNLVITQNVAACWKGGEQLNLSFSTNMAASMYLFQKEHQLPFEKRVQSPEHIQTSPVKIIGAPEIDAMTKKNDEWVLGDLAQFARKTERDHEVYLNEEAFALRNEGNRKNHRWILTGVLGVVSIAMTGLGIWICCWGRNLKERFKDLQIVSLLRSNWQRRSGRLRERNLDSEKAARFLRREQTKRMRKRETLKDHVSEAIRQVDGPDEPQTIEMSDV